MTNYTTNLYTCKRAILSYTRNLSEGTKRPNQKFIADMCYGAMASKSCVLSQIAHALQEDTQKINTIERLARNLQKPIPTVVRGNYLSMAKKYLPEEPVVHIDNSDVIKPTGKSFEGLGRVRDGSKSSGKKAVTEKGYYVTEATVLTNSMHPVSVFSEVWSEKSATFTSGGEFEYTKKVINACTADLGHVTFVMDRGYDDVDVFRLLNKLNQNYVIRLKLNRNIWINSKKISAETLCQEYKGKYATKVIYHGRVRKAKLTCVKGKINGLDSPLSIIIIFGLSDHPMILATNLDTSTKNQVISAMRHYFSRWRIEEYFRCKKQMFSFENFRVRSLIAINSLNFILSACMFFLAIIRERSDKNNHFRICIEAAAPLRPKVFFFYYRLADGLYNILSKAHSGIKEYFKPIRPNQMQMRIRGFK